MPDPTATRRAGCRAIHDPSPAPANRRPSAAARQTSGVSSAARWEPVITGRIVRAPAGRVSVLHG